MGPRFAARAGMVALLLALLPVTTSAARGAAEIQTGAILRFAGIDLGVNDTANLIVDCSAVMPCDPSSSGATRVGLRSSGLKTDAFAAGDAAEGWGAADAASGLSGHANRSEGPPVNMTVQSFTATINTAVSTVRITDPSLPGHELTLTHDFDPFEGDSFLVEVTIRNSGTAPLNDVRYRRVMDWDVEPTPGNEWVTIRGTRAAENILFSSDDGAASANPLSGRTYQESEVVCGTAYPGTCDFVDLGNGGPYPAAQSPADTGALFDLGFGPLAPGGSVEFFLVWAVIEGTPTRQGHPSFFADVPWFQFAEVAASAEPDCPDSAVPTDPTPCGALAADAGVQQGLPVTFFFTMQGVGGCIGGGSATGALVRGTDAGETFAGTPGEDSICSMGGNDRVRGLDGEDYIFTGAGHDRAKGGNRFDLIVGGAGRDRLAGQGHGDALFGQAGNDLLIGGPGSDDLFGGRGRDECRFGSGFLHGYGSCEEQVGG